MSAPISQTNNPHQYQSVPIMHKPHQLVEIFSSMSVLDKTTSQLRDMNSNHKKYDVTLLGNAPLIEDFQLPMSMPNIPASVK